VILEPVKRTWSREFLELQGPQPTFPYPERASASRAGARSRLVKYLLDTNVCVDFLNRHQGIVERIQSSSPEDLCLSSIVVAELRYGADRSRRKRRTMIGSISSRPRSNAWISTLPRPRVYGRIRSDLGGRGLADRTLRHDDRGAHPFPWGSFSFTDNEREFRRSGRVKIENWRQAGA